MNPKICSMLVGKALTGNTGQEADLWEMDESMVRGLLWRAEETGNGE